MQALLSIPKDIRPVSLVALGHPDVVPEPEDRFKEERVHRNWW
jgi:hypothetical protein